MLVFIHLLYDQNLFKKTWFPTLAYVQNQFEQKNTEVKGCNNTLVHKLQVQKYIVYCLSINLDAQTLITKVYLSLYQFIHKLGFYRPLYNNNLVYG